MSTLTRAQVRAAVYKEYAQLKKDGPVAPLTTIDTRINALFTQLGASKQTDKISVPDNAPKAGDLYTTLARKVFPGAGDLIKTYGLEPPAGAKVGIRRPATQAGGRRSVAARRGPSRQGRTRPETAAPGLGRSVAALSGKPAAPKVPPRPLPAPDAELQAIITSSEEPLTRLVMLRGFIKASPAVEQQFIARGEANKALREYATLDVIKSELATGKATDAGMNPSYLTDHLHVKRQKPEETQRELDMNAAMALLNPSTPFCCERTVTHTLLPSKDQETLKRASPEVREMNLQRAKKTNSGFVAERVAGQGVMGTLEQARVKQGEEEAWLEALAEQGTYELVVGKQDGIAERRTPPNNMVSRSSEGGLSISPIDNTCTGATIPRPRQQWVARLEQNVEAQFAQMLSKRPRTGVTARTGVTGTTTFSDVKKEAAILRGIERALNRVKTVQDSGVFLHLENSTAYEANATAIYTDYPAVGRRLKSL